MTMQRRSLLKATAIAASTGSATSLLATSAMAQAPAAAWPSQPLKFVIPFTAGSGTDVVGRAVSERLGPALGQSVVVENRGGAGGTIGANLVAKATDGHTVLVHSSSHVVNPVLFNNLPYDTLKDFQSITPLAALPNVLITNPSKGFRDVRDLVAKAKAAPGRFNYGSAGNGSATHLNAEKFRIAADIQAQHVPFRGTPEVITEIIAGRIDWYFCPIVSVLQQIRAGTIQALAIGTLERSDDLPGVPHIGEAGFAAAEYTFWVGMFAPSSMPRANADRLNAEVVRILRDPAFRTRMDALGAKPMPMTVAQTDTFVKNEMEAAARVVRAANIKVE
jgi:tripartite-type tricarboxylate transporter receptor subunit TctC